jgi:hypothetical protein
MMLVFDSVAVAVGRYLGFTAVVAVAPIHDGATFVVTLLVLRFTARGVISFGRRRRR